MYEAWTVEADTAYPSWAVFGEREARCPEPRSDPPSEAQAPDDVAPYIFDDAADPDAWLEAAAALEEGSWADAGAAEEGSWADAGAAEGESWTEAAGVARSWADASGAEPEEEESGDPEPEALVPYVFDTGDFGADLGGALSTVSAARSGDYGGALKGGLALAGKVAKKTGAKSSVKAGLGAALKGAGTGAAIGGIVGSVFPGIGTAIGTGVGAVVGAVGGFFANLFGKKKPKKLKKWQAKMLDKGKKELKKTGKPHKLLDATLALFQRKKYDKLKASGTLPSQVFAKHPAEVIKRGAQLNAGQGRTIRKALAWLEPGEQALASAAIATGVGAPVLSALKAIRAKVERDEERDEQQNEERNEEAPSVAQGMQPATPPEETDLPVPAWHIQARELPRAVFRGLLRHVPAAQRLPPYVLKGIAGLGAGPRDVSGVDAATGEYVLLPGETFAGVAEQLTGDPARAREVEACNPRHQQGSHRIRLPPGFLAYQRFDTGAVVQTEEEEEPDLDDEAPKKAAPKKDEPKKAAAAGDDPRANTTRRVWAVQAGEWPEKIARLSNNLDDPQGWWRQLKEANSHKRTKDNGGNWVRLNAGDLLNYPDHWRDHPRAVSAPIPGVPLPMPGTPPTVPPGLPLPIPVPGGGTMDKAVIHKAQVILGVFAVRHADVAVPSDYGRQVGDLAGLVDARFTQILKSFQVFWNQRPGVAPTNQLGIYDPATDNAINLYAQQEATQPLPPGVPTPAPSPPSPGPGGGATPATSEAPKSSGFGLGPLLAAGAVALPFFFN